jgi:PadR family transcriptional regulator, regulatory protein PadR
MHQKEEIRLSSKGLRVLRFFMEDPRQPRSGAEISRATKTGSGTLYPLLARLEAAGWIEGKWEEVDPRVVGRPRKRLYTLTAIGQRSAYDALLGLQLNSGGLAWST